MKKLLFTFSLLFFVSFGWAEENPSVEEELSRRLNAVQSSSPAEEERQKAVLNALASVSCDNQSADTCKALRFEDLDFLGAEDWGFRMSELRELVLEMFSSEGDVTFRQEKGFPDWHKEFEDLPSRGIKYIYIGEKHGTFSIPAALASIFFALRQEYPHAKILLATEFQVSENSDNTEFPIYFPGDEINPPRTASPLAKLPGLVSKLGIDVLQIDKSYGVLGETEEEECAIRVKDGIEQKICYGPGKFYLQNLGDLLIFADTRNLPVGIEEKFFRSLSNGFFGTSSLGMEKRNERWVRYLKAVEPYYDIVVVYGGKAHLTSPKGIGVIDLLEAHPHIQIDFTPSGEGPLEGATDKKSKKGYPVSWNPKPSEIKNYSKLGADDEGYITLSVNTEKIKASKETTEALGKVYQLMPSYKSFVEGKVSVYQVYVP